MSTALLLKAFLTRRPGLAPGATIPRIEASAPPARPEPETLARYRRLCGFPDDGHLPPTFPQMLAGGLHIRLLADPRFPLPVAGIVHFENSILQREALPADAEYGLAAHIEGHRDDPRGVLFDVVTVMTRGDRVVWEARTTVLSRSARRARPEGAPAARKPSRETTPGLPVVPLRTAMFHLPADLGRRYSALAGDYNPIHLSALTARPFGFKRAIIHGMWTLARAVGEMADDLPPVPRRVDVRFERPVFLPSRVHLAVTRDGPGALAFTLTSPDLRTRHFSGVVVHESAREAAPPCNPHGAPPAALAE